MDGLYVQILLIILAILFAGIVIGLIICSLGNDTPAEALCGWWVHPEPRRKRRTTIGPTGEVEFLEEMSTESYDGPPLDPVSRSKEKREPMSWELEHERSASPPPPPSSHSPSAGPGHSGHADASSPKPHHESHGAHGRTGSGGSSGSSGSGGTPGPRRSHEHQPHH